MGGAAASMAAIANLPSLTSRGLLQQGDKEGESATKSCARARSRCGSVVFSRANLTASSFSTSSSSKVGFRRSRRLSFLQGGHTVLFMIHRLACACNGDSKQRHQTVCNGLSNGSENAAHQVRTSGFLKMLLEV